LNSKESKNDLSVLVSETRVCPNTDFHCDSTGRCIPVTWACDGEEDCTDGLDESTDVGCLRRDTTVCPPNQFRCANHQCIDEVCAAEQNKFGFLEV